MSLMTSQILKFVDFAKSRYLDKSRYLGSETLFFFQIKKFITYKNQGYFMPEVTFHKGEQVNRLDVGDKYVCCLVIVVIFMRLGTWVASLKGGIFME